MLIRRRRTAPKVDFEELESKLVWIYGSPRTGSTWILEMLCHPLQLDPRSDLGFKWRADWEGKATALPVNGLEISGHLAPGIWGSLTGSDTVEAEDGTIAPRTLNREMGAFSGYVFSAAYADVWLPEVRHLTLVRLHAAIERARDAGLRLPARLPLVVIKEVDGSHAADVVMSLFPRSRMLFLVRDGRDVLDSLLDANSPAGWLTKLGWGRGPFESDQERLGWVRENCRNWVARMNVCTRAYEAHHPALRRRLRYEDLLADTPGYLRGLANWLDLPADLGRTEKIAERLSFAAIPEETKGPGMMHRAATPGRWREGLTPDEQELAQEIMGDRLTALGYEP